MERIRESTLSGRPLGYSEFLERLELEHRVPGTSTPARQAAKTSGG